MAILSNKAFENIVKKRQAGNMHFFSRFTHFLFVLSKKSPMMLAIHVLIHINLQRNPVFAIHFSTNEELEQ